MSKMESKKEGKKIIEDWSAATMIYLRTKRTVMLNSMKGRMMDMNC